MDLEINTPIGWMPITNRQKYYTAYEYDGLEILNFDLSPEDEIFKYIKNEVLVRNDENLYIIKSINHRGKVCTISCELDLDDWLSDQPIISTKDVVELQTKSLSEVIDYIKPNHWSVENAGIRDIRRTPDLTRYDVLMGCQEIYGVVYHFDTIHKIIKVIDPNQQVDTGLYITPELNRSNLTYIGDSKDRVTRISAYGKENEDGTFVNFASINGGKDYVEDVSYDGKVKWIIWRDERYTVAENLLADAKKKLTTLAFPKMSYSVTVNDLGRYDERYAFLDYQLYKLVHTVIDENTSIMQNIIQINRYHDHPENNEITLSTEAKKITSKIDSVIDTLGEDGQKLAGSVLQQAQEKATEIINAWAEKGYIYQTENEIYILDKLPKETAKNCIRMNLGGIAFSQNGWQGPYISAWTIDGRFNADFITAGKIKGLQLIGNTISNGLNFYVDADGNMQCINAKIQGNMTAGKITGETSINVGTDLYVGNNIYLGVGNGYPKNIYLTDEYFISLSNYAIQIQSGASRLYISNNHFTFNVNNDSLFSFSKERNLSIIYSDFMTTGNANIGGSLSVSKKVELYNELSVSGSVNLSKDVTVMGKQSVHEDFSCHANVIIGGNLGVVGNKNRIVNVNELLIKMNAVESASCYFTDEGKVQLDNEGKAIIKFDPLWLETVNTDIEYHVQLTPYCEVTPWIVEEYPDECIIAGKPNTKVNWHVSALQKGYETTRLEPFIKAGDEN